MVRVRSAEYFSGDLERRAGLARGLGSTVVAHDVALALEDRRPGTPSAWSSASSRCRTCAVLALRMRVSMSAMGSVIVMARLPSPARLGDAGDLAGVHHHAQADTAEPELAVHGLAAGRSAGTGCSPRTLNLGVRCCFSIKAFFAMVLPVLLSEREAEGGEEGPALVVGACGGDDGDVHAAGRVDACRSRSRGRSAAR